MHHVVQEGLGGGMHHVVQEWVCTTWSRSGCGPGVGVVQEGVYTIHLNSFDNNGSSKMGL